MVHTFDLHRDAAQDVATVRAFSSLTRRDADAVRAAVRSSGGEWTVEQHDDYDGYLSLLLTPTLDDRPTFLVSGRTGAVEVAELAGDAMEPMGCFSSIGAANTALKARLKSAAGRLG